MVNNHYLPYLTIVHHYHIHYHIHYAPSSSTIIHQTMMQHRIHVTTLGALHGSGTSHAASCLGKEPLPSVFINSRP